MKKKVDKRVISRAATAVRESYQGKHTIFRVDSTNDYVYVYSTEHLNQQLKFAMQILAGNSIPMVFRVTSPKLVT